MAFDVFRDTANKRHKTGSNLAALTVAEILPTSKVWNLSPQSSGYVDFLGGTLTLQDTGNLVLAGSVHDESTFSGDSWQLVVRIGNTEQVATAQGHLGAWISGGTDNTFSLPGQYPWCADHWSSVVNMGVSAHLSSNADQYNPNPPTPSNTMRTLSLAQQKEVGTWMYYLVDVTSGDPLSGHGIIKVKNSNSHKVIVSHGVQAINLDPEQEVTSFAGTLGGNWTVELINVPFEFAPATVSLQITVQ
jgi:hypothetical protein